MKQTSVEHIGRSQLIPGVLRTDWRGARVSSTDAGVYVTFFMIEQATLAQLPDADGSGDLINQINDALPPEWAESDPDWDRTDEALQDLVGGRTPRDELLDRYPDAVLTLYQALGEWPRTSPAVPVAVEVLLAAKQAFQALGMAECVYILDWARGSPLLETAPVAFPRFSYLTVDEVMSANSHTLVSRISENAAVASLCASVISIVKEAGERTGRGLYSTFEVRDAAEQGDEADER
jgi:hypothetical protein